MSSPLVDTANPWGHHQKYKSSPNQGAMINGEASCLQMEAEDTESKGNLEASRETNSRWTDCERSISAKSVRGRRRTLEDRYLIIRDFPKNKFDVKVIAAVFDGHGGTEAAEFCHDNFQSFLIQAMSSEAGAFQSQITNIQTSTYSSQSPRISSSYNTPCGTTGGGGPESSAQEFSSSTASVPQPPRNNQRASSSSRENSFLDSSGLSQILRSTFLALDEAFCQKYPKSNCGCTALVVAMDSMKSRVDFANVGDSAATVFRSGEAPSFTSDTDQAKDLNDSETTDTSSEIVLLNDIHNTNNESEADRIKKSGGFLFSVSGGTKRVNGSLTVTRAIGDVGLKPFVIGDPEVDVYEVEKTRDKFVILASDGFYDAISYDGDLATVCEQVEQKLKEGEHIPTTEEHWLINKTAPTLADLLCEEASRRNNSDNITVVCISLL